MKNIALVISLLFILLNAPSVVAAPSEQSPHNTTSNMQTSAPQKAHTKYIVISPTQVCKHVGQHVTVKFLVNHTHTCKHDGIVYLNESHDYSTCFAAIIAQTARKLFPADTDKAYKGKTVLITGLLEMIDGTPKIILNNPNQISIAK